MKNTININSTFLDALDLLNENYGKGLLILDKKKPVGFITDGDIRRFILNGGNIDDSIELAMNKNFVKLSRKPSYKEALAFKSKGIKLVPIINKEGKLIEIFDLNSISRIPIHEPKMVGNELKYLTDCIETNWISSQGIYVKNFEKLFSEIHKSIPATSTSSGTTALELAFKTIKKHKEGYVLVPDLTFGATLNAVINSGLTPLICPIKTDDFSIDLSCVPSSILLKTAAVCVVHLYGAVAEMKKIFELREKYNFFIVEDCAEALGSFSNNKRAGTFGDFSAFSFFGNKLITTGEGGMLLAKNEKFFKYINILKNHGMNNEKRYWHEVVGTNARMTNIQAAIGLGQLENLNFMVKKKREIHDKYYKKLSTLNSKLKIWHESFIIESSYWLNTIYLKNEIYIDKIIENGKKKNIDFRRCFYPMHILPAFKNFVCKDFDYSQSKELFDRLVCLPSGLNLQDDQISAVCEVIEYSTR